MIVGTGIDIVAIERVARLHQRHGERALRLLLSERERQAAAAWSHPAPRLAGRFAAKEAVMKALGTGWTGGVTFTQIEILNSPGGQPQVQLSGAAAARCEALGGRVWHLSISHERDHAVAQAILES
jgi:holo-[acyl-carrier protein] synthase